MNKRLINATSELLSSYAYGDAMERNRARKEARAAVKEAKSRQDAIPVLVAALRRIGCQDRGSCGPDEPDGYCFACAAIAEAEHA